MEVNYAYKKLASQLGWTKNEMSLWLSELPT